MPHSTCGLDCDSSSKLIQFGSLFAGGGANNPSPAFSFELVGRFTTFPSQELNTMQKNSCLALLFLIALLPALSALALASAQHRTGTPHPVALAVHGQVRYGDSRTPAANIIVRLETCSGGTTGQIMTDRDGKFLFSGLASAQYLLTIHAPGYRDVQQSVDLLTATSDYVNVYLVPEELRVKTSTGSIGYIDANVPVEAQKEFEKGEAALSQHESFQDALRHFENALSFYPKFFEAEIRLGTIQMDLGQWDNAEAALRRAVGINPRNPNALFALGELYLLRDRNDEAEKTLREGLKLDNRSWKGHLSLARTYWKRNDLANAGRQLALTLQLNPESAETHLLAGNVLTKAGKLAHALVEFGEYLRLAPKGPYAQQAREAIQRIKQRVARSK